MIVAWVVIVCGIVVDWFGVCVCVRVLTVC